MSTILTNSFYVMNAMHVGENSVLASIILNASHEVFKGHFPEHPVVPGVFQIQIIKEFLEEFTNSKLQLETSKEIKFIQPITPAMFENLNVKIEIKEKTNEQITFSAQLKNAESVFMKFRGTYKIV